MIITVAHQKGGTGKSTIATNLAVELKTSLLDLDKLTQLYHFQLQTGPCRAGTSRLLQHR